MTPQSQAKARALEALDMLDDVLLPAETICPKCKDPVFEYMRHWKSDQGIVGFSCAYSDCSHPLTIGFSAKEIIRNEIIKGGA